MTNQTKQTKQQFEMASNLKALLDARGWSIRRMAEESGLQFETLRRMYNDTTKQYQRETLATVCVTLGVGIGDVLVLREKAPAAE